MELYFSIDLESWAYPDDRRFIELNSSARKKIDNGFVLESIDKILDLLARYDQKITFFTIAELFEWYPDALRRIKNSGHEVAYHTHRHVRITSSEVMRKEILASQDFLREFRPIGFRAPEIYLPEEAIKPLVEFGFRYSSSVYGSHGDIFKHETDGIIEFPVSNFLYMSNKPRILNYPRPMNISMLFREIPFGGGYFLALLPLEFIEKIIESYAKAAKPVIMFAHNWQIIRPRDATFPDARYKITHPSCFPYTLPILNKVEFLLKKYRVGRMDELICSQKNIGIKK